MTSAGTKIDDEEKFILIDELIKLCCSNLAFYKKDNTIVGARMYACIEKLQLFLEKSVPVIREVQDFAPKYDFDENTPGNGYRSFVYIFDCAIRHTLKTTKYIDENRGNLLFRKSSYMKEIDTCGQIVESLSEICRHLITMHKNSNDGDLYSKEYSHDNLITRGAKYINQVCFYGRAIGFQYCNSMKPILRFLAISIASFSESYFSNRSQIVKSTSSIFTSSKYFMDPELCAQRIISVSQNAKIDFCKSYWFLAEGKLMHSMPQLFGYKVECNKVFKIPPEPMKIYSSKSNDLVDVPIPMSHIGKAPVSCRLLSARYRRGMVGEKSNSFKSDLAEPSKYLIIHSHGGGWIAQSSKSHELYLREWAVKMDIPILSIDYSLAPEAPFPRGLEDVFYAYCWALKNIELLGTTGENIVMAGDSAGANINTACVVKCIEMGIKKPRGLFNAYCPFLVNFAASPARFLSLVDPLLPYGFIMRVFKAYGAVENDANDNNDLSVNLKQTQLNSDDDSKHKIISNIYDDTEDGRHMLSPDSSKALETMWLKVKTSIETPDWQTNLGSIRETPSEDVIGEDPFSLRRESLMANEELCAAVDDSDDDILEMKFSKNSLMSNKERCAAADDDDDDFLEMKFSKTEEKPAKITSENEEYVNEFLEKYNDGTDIEVLKPRMRLNSKTPSEENIVLDIGMETFSVQGFQERIQKAKTSIIDAISSPFKQQTESKEPKEFALKRNWAFNENHGNSIPKAPDDEYVFTVPKNYLMSPYCAPDELLKEFPQTNIITIHLDPCLDDCVEFSKKLKRLGVNIKLDIVDGLVHGFLNFAQVSAECHAASMLCMQRIAELLDLPLHKME